jgi:hypothetical protein
MERDVDDLIEHLHESPVGTEDPNIVDPGAEPSIVSVDAEETDPDDTGTDYPHAVP